MIRVVNDHRGIVNKFLGDGFMAVFGASVEDAEQCQHAVDAAKAMLRGVEELNREGRIPTTRVGIGLHMGRVVCHDAKLRFQSLQGGAKQAVFDGTRSPLPEGEKGWLTEEGR